MAISLEQHAGAGRLALIDGHSLLHRAFFALPPLTGPQGQPTGALHGFLTMLLRMCDDERPTHLAVALDRPEPTYRHREFAEYKAQRAPMPSDLAVQVPLLRDVLGALGVAILEEPGAEADDLIGTVATRAAAEGFEVLVVTGDRDALQLVGPSVTVLYTRRGIREVDRMDEAAVLARYGVAPGRLVDVKALAGDASDNYPGVPAVGEKTACRLVAQYGSVEDLLDRLGDVGPPRVAKALGEHEATVRRNKRLATIQRDVPVAFDADGFRRRAVLPDGALPLLEALGLRAVALRFGAQPAGRAPGPGSGAAARPAVLPGLGDGAGADDGAAPPGGEEGAAPDSSPGGGEAGPPPAAERPPVARRSLDAAAFAAALETHPAPVAVAAAWTGPVPVGLGAWLDGAGEALLWEAGAESPPAPPALPPADRLIALDSKRLLHAYAPREDAPSPAPAFDAAIAGYLLDAERSAYPLDDLCLQAGVPAPRAGDLAEAAQALAALRAPLGEALRAHGLDRLYREVELPLVPVLAAMEQRGVLVDRGALGALEAVLAQRLREVEADIQEAAGEPFNVQSTQQLARILFERLGLKPPKKTKTGFSTDAAVLEQLAAEHPLPALVLTHRTLQKLQSTYVQALPGFIGADGRIHSDFRQTVAATGRISSNNPNLQNIPVRDEVGKPIRRVFRAPDGWRLVSADYSQVELRILAHFSGDSGLIAAFREGRDIHRATAAEVWGVPPEAVSESQRSAAKAVNFGIVYGISDFGLARQIGCDVGEAKAIIQRYFERYPGVRAYMDGVVAEARGTGAVRTMFGRLRRLPDITSRNYARRAFAERMAMNTPIQGTAADLIKKAMVAVHGEMRRAGLRSGLILQVHDELIVEAPEAEVAEVGAILRRGMEGAGELAVPLRVDVSAGPSWLDLEDLDLAAGDAAAGAGGAAEAGVRADRDA